MIIHKDHHIVLIVDTFDFFTVSEGVKSDDLSYKPTIIRFLTQNVCAGTKLSNRNLCGMKVELFI